MSLSAFWKSKVLLLLPLVAAGLFLLSGTAASQAQVTRGDILAADWDKNLCEGAFAQQIEQLTVNTAKPLTARYGIFGRDGLGKCRIFETSDISSSDTLQLLWNSPSDYADSFEHSLRGSAVPLTSEKVGAVLLQAQKDADEASGVSKVTGWIISTVIGWFTYLMAALASLSASIFSSILELTIKNGIDDQAPIIAVGWKIIRDFMNLVFIFAIIYIAVSTMLGRGDNNRQLLVRLVLMGILINFSKVISMGLIRVSDSVTAFVAKDMTMSGIGTLLFKMLKPDEIGTIFTSGGVFADSVQAATQFVFVTLLTVTLLILAGYFVVRFAGLYVLVVISPVAYALNILPSTKRYADMWWNYFIRYLVFLPVAVLMIRLALLIINEGGASALFTDSTEDPNTPWVYAVLIAFLWAALMVGRSAGMVGADMVERNITKGSLGLLRAGGRTIARGQPLNWGGALLKKGGTALTSKSSQSAGVLAKARQAAGKTLSGAGTVTAGLGKGVSVATAAPQATVKGFQEWFKLGDRNRDKQIKEMMMEGLLFSLGGSMDKEEIEKLSPEQLARFGNDAIKNGNAEDIEKFLEAGGRKAADIFMTELIRLRNDGHEINRQVAESIAKTFYTSRGVSELNFEQNRHKYANLSPEIISIEREGKDPKEIINYYVPSKEVIEDLFGEQLAAFKVEELREYDKKYKREKDRFRRKQRKGQMPEEKEFEPPDPFPRQQS